MQDNFWHVLIVTSGHETKARDLIREWGRAECYVPMRRFWKRETRKGKRVRIASEAALYPGYLFFRCDLHEVGASLVKAKSGGKAVLMVDGVPACISPSFIHALLKFEEVGRYDETLAEAERFTQLMGKRVTIRDGVLAGFIVTIMNPVGVDKVQAVTDGPIPIKTVLDVGELIS